MGGRNIPSGWKLGSFQWIKDLEQIKWEEGNREREMREKTQEDTVKIKSH